MIRISVVVFLALAIAIAQAAQQPAKATSQTAASANDIFSGTVTSVAPDFVTVVRKVPARADEVRSFIVDKDTKIEGKLKANERVTVRFKADADGGVHALRVIVRADVRTNTGPGRTGTGR